MNELPTESPIIEELRQMLGDPPGMPPPARHCSCGKPATRGGLCSAEPAAPAIDYRELLIRYLGHVQAREGVDLLQYQPHGFDGLTEVELQALHDVSAEARRRYF